MTKSPRVLLFFLVTYVLSSCASGAWAQSAGLDEAVGPDGVTQRIQLTPVQRNAILSAVGRQHLRSSSGGIVAIVGAPVPPSAALRDLPHGAELGAAGGGLLKYATVADQIVVVDPIRMRVVDVIHQGAGP